jgi:hypothetical protein
VSPFAVSFIYLLLVLNFGFWQEERKGKGIILTRQGRWSTGDDGERKW